MSKFQVSKNKLVYFDLKDESASGKFFCIIYNLPGPLEYGLLLQVTVQPRLSPQYGFSVTIQSITPVGEGSLKRAANLLMAKLEKEGLFDQARKRALPFPPSHIWLIASYESAAYADFNKILNARWGGVKISHIDVQVQGEPAVGEAVKAIEQLNTLGDPPEVIVITRGGGSADDLAAFSTEQVTRAVAASWIPTLVAIGHEVDISLAELAADQRASTPSNAAELLVPDKKSVFIALESTKKELRNVLEHLINSQAEYLKAIKKDLGQAMTEIFNNAFQHLEQLSTLLHALNPELSLKRGFAILRIGGKVIKTIGSINADNEVSIQMADGTAKVSLNEVQLDYEK